MTGARVTRLGDFLPFGLLLEAQYVFEKDLVTQRNGDINRLVTLAGAYLSEAPKRCSTPGLSPSLSHKH
jgi:hypothetical protein